MYQNTRNVSVIFYAWNLSDHTSSDDDILVPVHTLPWKFTDGEKITVGMRTGTGIGLKKMGRWKRDHPNPDSYTWRIQVEYRNGEIHDTFSDGNILDSVLALMENIADLFV